MQKYRDVDIEHLKITILLIIIRLMSNLKDALFSLKKQLNVDFTSTQKSGRDVDFMHLKNTKTFIPCQLQWDHRDVFFTKEPVNF